VFEEMAKRDAVGEAVLETAEEAEIVKDTIKSNATNTIDDLDISDSAKQRLKDAGYTLISLAQSMVAELTELEGIGETTALKVINAAKERLGVGCFEQSNKIFERRKVIGRISTGSKELDALLGGGVETQAITEAYGKFSSGKSQLAFQLCVNAQLPEDKGGLNGAVRFIDTENTFRPERVIAMAEAKGLNADEALKRVYVARALNSDNQIDLIEKADDFIKEKNVRLIIIDSLMSEFRSDYMGRGQLADRQQKLNRHLHTLQRLAESYNAVIYLTNQVMDRPDVLFGDPTAPIGGNVLAHLATYRLYLRRSKEDRRIVKLVDSPNLPDGECVFRVTTEGIKDV
jgi:DNA repair protein RadA